MSTQAATDHEHLRALLRDLTLPVIAAPMFLVSGPELVLAQCRAGIIGSFPALNARTTSQLDEWLSRIGSALTDLTKAGASSAPFGVNLIVHRSNTRLSEDLAVLEQHRVPLVITSLGAREDVNQTVHGWGGMVLHDVISNEHAHKAIDKGADGLIAVAAGAGGHAGKLSPFALVQEIRAWFDGPLLLAGAIASGRSILAAQAMGADGTYIGTPWIACTEAMAAPAYQQAIVEAHAHDIVNTNLFTGVHGNYLRSSIIAAGFDPDHLPKPDPSAMDFGAGAAKAAKAWKDIWGAGQGIGVINDVVPVSERVTRLAQEYRVAKADLSALWR